MISQERNLVESEQIMIKEETNMWQNTNSKKPNGPQEHKANLKMFQMKFTYLKEPRKRHRTTPEQLSILMSSFDKQPMPDADERKVIAQLTGMSSRSVQVWFQNRRAKFRGNDSSSPDASPSSAIKNSQRQSEARKLEQKKRRTSSTLESDSSDDFEEEDDEKIEIIEDIPYCTPTISSPLSTPNHESPAISPESFLSTEDEEHCYSSSSPSSTSTSTHDIVKLEESSLYQNEDIISWESDDRIKNESESFLELYQIEFPSAKDYQDISN